MNWKDWVKVSIGSVFIFAVVITGIWFIRNYTKEHGVYPVYPEFQSEEFGYRTVPTLPEYEYRTVWREEPSNIINIINLPGGIVDVTWKRLLSKVKIIYGMHGPSECTGSTDCPEYRYEYEIVRELRYWSKTHGFLSMPVIQLLDKSSLGINYFDDIVDSVYVFDYIHEDADKIYGLNIRLLKIPGLGVGMEMDQPCLRVLIEDAEDFLRNSMYR